MHTPTYFHCKKEGGRFIKTLLNKEAEGGSVYPSLEDFTEKIATLKKYLGDFVAPTEIIFANGSIGLVQDFIDGEDLFDHLKKVAQNANTSANVGLNTSPALCDFVHRLEVMHKETGMLPDLINTRNILLTKAGAIRIVDVWPLFF